MSFTQKLNERKYHVQNFISPEAIVIKQQNTYALPLFQFDVSKEINLDKSIKNIKAYRELNPISQTTNVYTSNGWRSKDGIEKETDVFNDDLNIILDKLKITEKSINDGVYFKSEIMKSWAIIYKKGDFAKRHNHFSGHAKGALSWVSTLYLTDSNSAIVFNQHNKEDYRIYPRKGTLLIFSPLLMHSVDHITDDEERIVIAANIGRKSIREINE